MKRGLTWAVAVALFACASPKPPVMPTRAPVQGARICWREENLGQEPKLMHLVAQELTTAGYALVDNKCDFQLGFTTQWVSQYGRSEFSNVTMYIRKPDGVLIDKVEMPFAEDTMPREETPRLARLVVNELNRNQKTYNFLDPAAATAPTPADSASIANTRFKFCDVATFVDFYANQTALVSGNIKCASHWTQSGDHVEFDCNGLTLYDTHVRAPYLFGTWRRARPDADPSKSQRGQICLQQLGPAVAAVE